MSPLSAPHADRNHPRDRRTSTRSDRPATAGGTALAVRPDRRAAPGAAPERRPSLRVVDETRLRAAARQRRMRVLMIVAGIVTVVSIFALASFHAMLLANQGRLDQLHREVAAERAEYEALRQEVAELESPDRIVTAAEELGMVPPDEITWLVPTVAPETGGDVDPEAPQPRAGVAAPWHAVKPFLVGAQ